MVVTTVVMIVEETVVTISLEDVIPGVSLVETVGASLDLSLIHI